MLALITDLKDAHNYWKAGLLRCQQGEIWDEYKHWCDLERWNSPWGEAFSNLVTKKHCYIYLED